MRDCTAHCPKCGRPTATPYGPSVRQWFCHHCSMPFEDEADGTTGYGDPAQIAARNDEHAKRERERRQTRMQQRRI